MLEPVVRRGSGAPDRLEGARPTVRFDGKRLFATGAGSGLAAIVAQPGNPYGAVKGATLAFSRQLAADLAERGGGSYERGAPLSGEERA